jgi:hypothetical protein
LHRVSLEHSFFPRAVYLPDGESSRWVVPPSQDNFNLSLHCSSSYAMSGSIIVINILDARISLTFGEPFDMPMTKINPALRKLRNNSG